MTERARLKLDAKLEAMDIQARRELTAAPWEQSTADTSCSFLPNGRHSCNAPKTYDKNTHRKVTA